MSGFAKPKVLVSQCLGVEACRFDGAVIPDEFVDRLREHAEVIAVCPEVAIGLGTPRDPVQIVADARHRKLVQPSSGADLTEQIESYTLETVEELAHLDGAILKSRSPSCGIHDVTIRNARGGSVLTGKGRGMFADGLMRAFPGKAVEDEARLSNERLRDHFLTKLYCLADFRRTREEGTMKALVDFHSRQKLTLMAYHQVEMRQLGRLVANEEGLEVGAIFESYQRGLERALARMARYTSHVNVLMHGFGYYSQDLTARERRHYLSALDDYREGKMALVGVKQMMVSRLYQFDLQYLIDQSYFQPYPDELVIVNRKTLRRMRTLA